MTKRETILLKRQQFPLIGEYDNAQDCQKQHPELNVSQINRVLRNIIHSHKGFVFKFKDKDIV